MFEFSVACKYLIPRWRQLSVSIISLISIAVIALVVWLILVFFSVANGLEKMWVEKLVGLTAPIRLTPTEAYYRSYYYNVDGISLASGFSQKSIGEKLNASVTDPYDPDTDEEIPGYWPKPDQHPGGQVKDLVKEAFASIKNIEAKGKVPLKARDFSISASQLNLMPSTSGINPQKPFEDIPDTLAYVVYLGSFDPDNTVLARTLLENESIDPRWIHKKDGSLVLPTDPILGDGVLLPKTFKDAGIMLGDHGYLSYYATTPSSTQEQRVPVYVAGFFDHGVMPMGSKFALVNHDIATLIRASNAQQEQLPTAGINVRFEDFGKAESIKMALQDELEKQGIDRYWRVETFREYEFTKDFLQQLESEKNLFSLIAVVIIIVACSNIISMLIILVNDKKKEIGILLAMGSSPASIAAIFGLCGMVMGALGSLLGISLAIVTLHNLQALLGFFGNLQGHDVFNAMYYGKTLPNELSYEALGFVLVATVLVSLLAGVIPAIKASLLKPSTILRSE
jgi:lipoprotein-releasing system permease protein